MAVQQIAQEGRHAAIAWCDEWLIGVAALDLLHRQFVDAIAALQSAVDADLSVMYQRMGECAERQFEEENMRMAGSDFPPRQCHVDEHHAVMTSIRLVSYELAAGHRAEARRLADALADWFPKHIVHLDSALSHWLFKSAALGKPVVLRRGAAARSGSAAP